MSDQSQPTVRDYMTENPTTLSPDDALLQAVLSLRSLSIRHLPIVENGKLVGLLTEGDIARASPSILTRTTPEEYNQVFEQTPIRKVMIKNVTAVGPDTPLGDAVAILMENKWSCLPVVNDDAVIGILTLTDVLRYTKSTLESSTGSITLDI
jgi:acetoin utilization protein AcuB